MSPSAGTQETHEHSGKRQYIRIPSIVPVDYQFISRQRGPLGSEVRTGLTRDMSANGLCLLINTLPAEIGTRLEQRDLSDIDIVMDIAVARRTLRIQGRIVWATTVLAGQRRRYRVGVEYQNITRLDADTLLGYAKRAARRPKVIRATVAALAAASLAGVTLLGVTHVLHREEMRGERARTVEANKRYHLVADDLESFTADLSELARELRASQRAREQAPSGAGDASGAPHEPDADYEPEVVASAVLELRSNIARLRSELGRSDPSAATPVAAGLQGPESELEAAAPPSSVPESAAERALDGAEEPETVSTPEPPAAPRPAAPRTAETEVLKAQAAAAKPPDVPPVANAPAVGSQEAPPDDGEIPDPP